MLDLVLWHLVEEAWKSFSQHKIDPSVYPKNMGKVACFDGGSLDPCLHSNMFHFGFHFISIYFCLILFWSGQVEVQIKAHARVAFFEFSRIIAYRVLINLV